MSRRVFSLIAAFVTIGGIAPIAPSHARETDRTGLWRPSTVDLVRAAQSRDRLELERLADRMGLGRLTEAMGHGDRAVVLAALKAVAVVPGGIRATGSITPLLRRADVIVQITAARLLGHLLDGREPSDVADWEIPGDEVMAACRSLVQLADSTQADNDARIAALESLARARPRCGVKHQSLSPLDSDRGPNAELRLSAVYALDLSDEDLSRRLRALLGDPDKTVAAATASRLCGSRAIPGDLRSAARGESAERLLGERNLSPEDAVPLLDCFDAGKADDRKILEKSQRGGPAAVRARATELLQSTAK